jgi:hypothetical protein
MNGGKFLLVNLQQTTSCLVEINSLNALASGWMVAGQSFTISD